MGLVGIMGVVFLAWRIPRLEPLMRKWFLHRPVVLGGRISQWQNSVTLFTSVVSLLSAHFGRGVQSIPADLHSHHSCPTSLLPISPSIPLRSTRSVPRRTRSSPLPHRRVAPLSPPPPIRLTSLPSCFSPASRRHSALTCSPTSSVYLGSSGPCRRPRGCPPLRLSQLTKPSCRAWELRERYTPR